MRPRIQSSHTTTPRADRVIHVRIPLAEIDRMDRAIARLGHGALAVPTQADIMRAALAAYLNGLERRGATPTEPEPKVAA